MSIYYYSKKSKNYYSKKSKKNYSSNSWGNYHNYRNPHPYPILHPNSQHSQFTQYTTGKQIIK